MRNETCHATIDHDDGATQTFDIVFTAAPGHERL